MRPLGKGYPSTTPNIDQIWKSIDFLRQCVGLEADKMIVMLIYRNVPKSFSKITLREGKFEVFYRHIANWLISRILHLKVVGFQSQWEA